MIMYGHVRSSDYGDADCTNGGDDDDECVISDR